MKAILEFNLPEESSEHQTAVDAAKWKGVLWDLDQWLRSQVKHGGKTELQPVRDQIHELMAEDNLQFD